MHGFAGSLVLQMGLLLLAGLVVLAGLVLPS
jgi:hypothetical protein